ncbi:interleukin-12 subunit beta [Clarias gariepinus]|uniref:interleukin-12 subunit beta n=1 Tax=Clarias gariepinus TaxID=13013 RepID=UPI00234C8E93|nr:interleukin-12 subunit beta [Clarias gariepinus]
MRTSLNIITFLCLCSMRVTALDKFPKKFEAGKIESEVTLTCDGASNTPVTWKFNGEDATEVGFENIVFDGHRMTLQKFNEEQTGNFSCWSGGQEVDYTYVLLDVSDTITDSPVSCTAESFNCTSTISCTMSEKGYKHFRLRDERTDSCWLSPSKGRFNLTHTTNPFAEEATPIVVLGEGISDLGNYFKITVSFYMRDIIRPGVPQISVVIKSSGRVLEVNPPLNWTQPLSYYPLEHEIEFRRRDDGKIDSVFYTQPNNTDPSGGGVAIPPGTSKLRVRCRDSLLLSQWSEWTQWQNVGKRRPKNGKKLKKKDKKKNKHSRKREDKIERSVA